MTWLATIAFILTILVAIGGVGVAEYKRLSRAKEFKAHYGQAWGYDTGKLRRTLQHDTDEALATQPDSGGATKIKRLTFSDITH